jgi:hypothetical protein
MPAFEQSSAPYEDGYEDLAGVSARKRPRLADQPVPPYLSYEPSLEDDQFHLSTAISAPQESYSAPGSPSLRPSATLSDSMSADASSPPPEGAMSPSHALFLPKKKRGRPPGSSYKVKSEVDSEGEESKSKIREKTVPDEQSGWMAQPRGNKDPTEVYLDILDKLKRAKGRE